MKTAYKIIGADGREYGPVTAEQLKQWITEGRANAQSKVLAEGAAEWKFLGSFPEFDATVQSVPPPLAVPVVPPRQTLSDPASKKIPAGICGILLGGFGVHKFVLGYTGAGLIMLLGSALTCFIVYPIFYVIGLIEGIIYLTKSDEEFVRTYIEGRKEWF